MSDRLTLSSLARAQSARRSGLWLTAGLAVYVFVPFIAVRFFCLALIFWGLANIRRGKLNLCLVLTFAAFVYACAFILTPMNMLLLGPTQAIPFWLSVVAADMLLVGFGCVWLCFCGSRAKPFWIYKFAPRLSFVCIWCILLIAVHLAPWMADVPYGGDEHYHSLSILVSWTLLREIVQTPAAVIPVFAWLVCAWAVFRYELRRVSDNPAATGQFRSRPVLILLVSLLVIAACCSPWAYSVASLTHPYTQDRVLRFPPAQSWLSAVLGSVCVENWRGMWIFSNEVIRLLPMLSLLLLGFLLGGDRHWRGAPVLITCLASLAVLTVPNLVYHGTILYLELPAVLLSCVVLSDSKHWLECPATRLGGRLSWWAVLLLGFLKETAVVMTIIFVTLRALWQMRRMKSQTDSWLARFVRAEGRVIFCAIGPSALYLCVRHFHHVKPYGAQFANLLDGSLWFRSFHELSYQCGFILLLAVCGVVMLLRDRRWHKVLVGLALFAGMHVFVLSNESQWVGLARFNLLLLPPVVILAWEGLTAIRRRSQSAATIAVLVLLAANFLMRPVDLRGQRGAWGNSDERWYSYHSCFADVLQTNPNARILLGNMNVAYGYSVVANQLRWQPFVLQYAPPPGSTPTESLTRTFAYAASNQIDVVIYRNEGNVVLPPNFSSQGFVLATNYPARIGGLIVYKKQAGP